MRFLADESCDAAVVAALRGAGHDVKSVADTMRGAADAVVLATALLGGRLLITEDKDFGEMVFAARESITTPRSVNAYGGYWRPPCPLEITICDLKFVTSCFPSPRPRMRVVSRSDRKATYRSATDR